MAKVFLKNKKQLNNTVVLMISIEDVKALHNFYNTYQLYSAPYLHIMQDSQFEFYKIFGTSVIPSFFVYEKGKLVKKIIGETKIENLLF